MAATIHGSVDPFTSGRPERQRTFAMRLSAHYYDFEGLTTARAMHDTDSILLHGAKPEAGADCIRFEGWSPGGGDVRKIYWDTDHQLLLAFSMIMHQAHGPPTVYQLMSTVIDPRDYAQNVLPEDSIDVAAFFLRPINTCQKMTLAWFKDFKQGGKHWLSRVRFDMPLARWNEQMEFCCDELERVCAPASEKRRLFLL